MDDSKQEEYERAFLRLKHSYIRRLHNTVRVIDNILELKKTLPISRNDLLRAQALVHGLAGSGTTFGYPQVSETGREADLFIEKLLCGFEDTEHASEADHQEIIRLLQKSQQICSAIYNEARQKYPELANTNIDQESARQGRAHIFVVEDDGDVASAISQGLQSKGMAVQIASSGEGALHYLARVRPDLVILDVLLTGMNGIEVLQQIKQNSEFLDIPVIILATRYNESDEQFSLRAGALAYIRKPIDIAAFTEQVSRVVRGKVKNTQSI